MPRTSGTQATGGDTRCAGVLLMQVQVSLGRTASESARLRPTEGKRPKFRAQRHRQAFSGPKGNQEAPYQLFGVTNSPEGKRREAAR